MLTDNGQSQGATRHYRGPQLDTRLLIPIHIEFPGIAISFIGGNLKIPRTRNKDMWRPDRRKVILGSKSHVF